ncbi:MAG: penicillin-binding protein 2 [Parachlamydiales bacterium]|nr:penicillin-binding protein 2 [Parachlamydiales bacterium]
MKPYLKVDRKDRKRLVIISFFIFFLFCLIVVQFYKLQIIEGDKWLKLASLQHQHLVVENFQRGQFYSNTSVRYDQPDEKIAIVQEVPKFHLFIDPESIAYKHKTIIAKKIVSLFDIKTDQKEKIFSDFFKKSRSRKILSWIDKNKKNEIEKWWREFAKSHKIASNAIFFVQDYKRSYPFGSLLGQVLHTTQEEKDPKTLQAIPTGGLELYFNEYLKGSIGKRIITRSPRHPLDTGKVIEKPQNGKDIYLTINHYLQAIAEEELEKGVKNVNGKGGWAIMMDPNTGEILAIAQYPKFDIRKYPSYFNDEQLKDYTKIKPIIEPFEPGSIMKPITLAVCFKANEEMQKLGRAPIFYPDEKIACANNIFPGRSKPITDGRVHKYMNMYMAIQKSSNVYFARLTERVIQRFSDEWYRKQLDEMFGFGRKTEIELPSEEPGFLPSINKYYPSGAVQWSKCTPFSLAIGYNLLVNSIQMVKAYSIIVNGGYDIKPTILKKIVDHSSGEEKVIFDNSNNLKKRKRVLSEISCLEIQRAMKFITKAGGTSPLGDIKGYTEGGKSGTAEKIKNGKYDKSLHVSSFIGFVPASKPRFVLMISVDEPEKKFVPGLGKLQQGGVCAAPIFKEISTRALKYLGVAPDDPFGYPYPDPRRNPDKADWAKEIEYMKNLYISWNK